MAKYTAEEFYAILDRLAGIDKLPPYIPDDEPAPPLPPGTVEKIMERVRRMRESKNGTKDPDT